ncbi:hypothetical protein [Rubritalea tangerina]|uniref:hypothetical protein n=1 Tax=Rubritalea tangerina TaxID=430798 RepID=UPI00361492F7
MSDVIMHLASCETYLFLSKLLCFFIGHCVCGRSHGVERMAFEEWTYGECEGCVIEEWEGTFRA